MYGFSIQALELYSIIDKVMLINKINTTYILSNIFKPDPLPPATTVSHDL